MPEKKMSNSVKITLIISVAIIILVIIGIYSFKPSSMENTISVSGQATEKVTPDLITIYFNVQTENTSSKEADDANSAIVDKLKSAIVAVGFKEDDLKTENYNINPEYDYTNGQQELKDYIASHSLKIEFSTDKKDKIGSVIDAGTNAGAGISYINFELSPTLEQQYKAAAIKIAATDAKVKAEAIAEGFNKKIGGLVSVSLDSFNYNPFRVYDSSVSGSVPSAEGAKSAVTSITPSEQDVTAYVTAVYKIG